MPRRIRQHNSRPLRFQTEAKVEEPRSEVLAGRRRDVRRPERTRSSDRTILSALAFLTLPLGMAGPPFDADSRFRGVPPLAQKLRARGHDPEKVAHFINRLVFCMFAEDADLLPNKMFVRWSEIDPSIFGTLFVRGLDPDKRAETGSEYTDRGKIMMIIEPVITWPLIREWEAVRASILAVVEPAGQGLEDAVKGAAGYPELAEELRMVQGRLVDRPQLELFDEGRSWLEAARGHCRCARPYDSRRA
jgi:hypothetical protein